MRSLKVRRSSSESKLMILMVSPVPNPRQCGRLPTTTGSQLEAMGIAGELEQRGAVEGDLVMIDKYDFEFSPGMTNPYIPEELLERDAAYEVGRPATGAEDENSDETLPWRPFQQGGFLDVDVDELVGFTEYDDWDMLDEEKFDEDTFAFSDDEVWTS